VKEGDCHFLPSGTVHALGAGILVAEVQTPSDTTFRVYDWGRTGRALHINESLACIDFQNPPPRATSLNDDDRWTTLAQNEFFRIDEVLLPHATPHLLNQYGLRTRPGPVVIIVLDGSIELEPGLSPTTILLPAAVTGWEPKVESGTRILAVALS
jgi:mannose-6-phosphate isomerase